ncbi:DUF2218 domain-containing protein [Vibrio rotiferianus]|nr:DUF2218 domain-containing protein [Vibrio rotiferianus]
MITCGAESEELLGTVKGVVSAHVEMFSRRETLKLNWAR